MNRIISLFDFGERNLVRTILKSSSFSAMAETLEYAVDLVEAMSGDFNSYGDRFRGNLTIRVPSGARPQQAYVYWDFRIVIEKAGLEALNEQFADLKRVLIED